MVLDFNRKSSDYRIEVRDYSEFNTDDDYTAGLTKLITEIGSGAVPDILITDSLPMDTFGAKGLFEDLWPYIEADEEIGGRAGVVEPVFNAHQPGGQALRGHQRLLPCATIAGPSSIIGTEPGWTYDDMFAALDQMPEGCELFSLGTTRNDVFSSICTMNLSNFVDWNTGECSFDSEDFISLMEFANRFPETFDWENHEWTTRGQRQPTRIKEGRQLLVTLSALRPVFLQLLLRDVQRRHGPQGLPRRAGHAAPCSTSNGTGLAISSTCADIRTPPGASCAPC